MKIAALGNKTSTIDAEQLSAWLAASIAKAVKVDLSDIDPDIAFDRFGLDSVAAVEMTRELSVWIGEELSPTLLYDFPTIGLLSEHLARHLSGSRG